MEALVFALIATRNMYRQQKGNVPEPAEFQSFDLQALRFSDHATDNSQSRSSDRKRSYVPQVAS
jgi:hypothetical protein